MLSLLASTVLTAAMTASCNAPNSSCPQSECQSATPASPHAGHAAVVSAAAPAGHAQVNRVYRSNSYEPTAVQAAVPKGGQVYRSYSYAPASAPIYRPASGRSVNHGYGGKPLYLIPKTLR